MLIVKPDSLPRFWWLYPWTVCRQLHKNAVALRSLCDRQDAVLTGKQLQRGRYRIKGFDDKDAGCVTYFFIDGDARHPRYVEGVEVGHFCHYNAKDKSFSFTTDPAQAIRFCEHLNTSDV